MQYYFTTTCCNIYSMTALLPAQPVNNEWEQHTQKPCDVTFYSRCHYATRSVYGKIILKSNKLNDAYSSFKWLPHFFLNIFYEIKVVCKGFDVFIYLYISIPQPCPNISFFLVDIEVNPAPFRSLRFLLYGQDLSPVIKCNYFLTNTLRFSFIPHLFSSFIIF